MLPVLAAERQLSAIEAASVPHMKDDARREVFGRYLRVVERSLGRAKTMIEALMEAGVPVVYKPGRKTARKRTGHGGTKRKGQA